MINDLAKYARSIVSRKIAYFAVPYKHTEYPEVSEKLGQDHCVLANIFDMVLPMVYHRMIGKPVDYIVEYTNYLKGLQISSKILPIIQVKDIPDQLEDNLSLNEIQEAIELSIQPPSAGVAIFAWDHAIEKSKLEPVSKILRKL